MTTTDAQTDAAAREREARKQVVEIFILGVALAVAGVIFASIAWPGTTTSFDGTTSLHEHATGSMGWALIGLGIAGIGQFCCLVALIAWGVRYGNESSRRAY